MTVGGPWKGYAALLDAMAKAETRRVRRAVRRAASLNFTRKGRAS